MLETLEKYWYIPPTQKPKGFNQTDFKSLKMANKRKKEQASEDTNQMLYLIHQHKNKQIDIKNEVPRRNIFQSIFNRIIGPLYSSLSIEDVQ